MGKGEKGGVLLLRDDTRVAVNRDGHGRKPQRTPRGSYVLPTLLCSRKRKGPTVRWRSQNALLIILWAPSFWLVVGGWS